jgi:two-component system chemotaxis response regulator CheY
VPGRVLIVDDSETIRLKAKETLEKAGFEVVGAESGTTGMAAFREHQDLALVLLDLNMPGISGLALLEWVRREKRAHTPPVVMMTTEMAPALMERAKRAGAAGWVIKPFNPEQLVAVAKRLTRDAAPDSDG